MLVTAVVVVANEGMWCSVLGLNRHEMYFCGLIYRILLSSFLHKVEVHSVLGLNFLS